ncbi:substrate-binding domain-containing protein [Paenibacillus alkaliterrae]|uniref:substrate-binding domain-containing protein n=1 Tax=Paenibacillus alkaliterrae TaxID=320909 RepID=UPI001F1C7DE9|nr:substrate-binding domain-containing protein [Paenibacillus alkaliterrae]MCF2939358.1 substrate-binding domain-containing protein [Paenibacillus alkaliterrae]
MSYRKWNIGIAILFFLFAFLLTSFLLSTLRVRDLLQPLLSESTPAGAAYHVMLIAQEVDNPYWRSIERGAQNASAAYGMHLDYVGPFRINPNEQIKLLEKAIASKVDAVVLQGINDPRYRAIIDQAVSKGIPIITIDTDEPGSKRLSYVGTDNFAAGIRMGELVAQSAADQASIAVLIGNEQAPNQQLRLEGLRAVIERSPRLTIVDVRSSNISRLQAAGEAEDMLTKQPNIDFMIGLSALDGVGIAETVNRVRSRKVQIFAFDDLEETLNHVRKGVIEATIIQQPYQMGYTAISQLNDFFHGKTPPKQHFTTATVVDQSSLNKAGNGENDR